MRRDAVVPARGRNLNGIAVAALMIEHRGEVDLGRITRTLTRVEGAPPVMRPQNKEEKREGENFLLPSYSPGTGSDAMSALAITIVPERRSEPPGARENDRSEKSQRFPSRCGHGHQATTQFCQMFLLPFAGGASGPPFPAGMLLSIRV